MQIAMAKGKEYGCKVSRPIRSRNSLTVIANPFTAIPFRTPEAMNVTDSNINATELKIEIRSNLLILLIVFSIFKAQDTLYRHGLLQLSGVDIPLKARTRNRQTHNPKQTMPSV